MIISEEKMFPVCTVYVEKNCLVISFSFNFHPIPFMLRNTSFFIIYKDNNATSNFCVLSQICIMGNF